MAVGPSSTTEAVKRARARVRREAGPVLESWTLGQVLATRPPSHVVTLTAGDTVATAVTTLARHKVLSAPVLDHAGDRFVGFLGTHDVAIGLVKGVWPGLLRGNLPPPTVAAELEDAAAEFLEGGILPLLPLADDGRMVYTGHAETPLSSVIANGFLEGGHAGEPGRGTLHHRIAVFDFDALPDERGSTLRISSILSQSDVMRWLISRAADIPALDTLTVEAVGLAAGPIATVGADEPALQALATLAKSGISSLAVVAPKGETAGPSLMGAITCSDMRELHTPEDFGKLTLPVGEFLASRHGVPTPGRAEAAAGEKGEPVPRLFGGVRLSTGAGKLEPGDDAYIAAICVRLHHSVMTVVKLFIEHSVHHVFVIDAHEEPVACVTPTDVLRLLVEE